MEERRCTGSSIIVGLDCPDLGAWYTGQMFFIPLLTMVFSDRKSAKYWFSDELPAVSCRQILSSLENFSLTRGKLQAAVKKLIANRSDVQVDFAFSRHVQLLACEKAAHGEK